MVKRLDDWFSGLSVKRKLLSVLMMMIIGISMISVYSLQESFQFMQRSNEYNDLYSEIGKLKQYNDEMYDSLSRYMKTMQNENLVTYNEVNDKYYGAIQRINTALEGEQEYVFMLRAINNSYRYIGIQGNTAIRLRLNGDAEYYTYYYKALRVNQYIKMYFDDLLQESLKNGDVLKTQLMKESLVLRQRTLASVVLVSLFCIGFGMMFADYITGNINQIVYLASEIARGNLKIRGPINKAGDEVGAMTRSFDEMSLRMRQMVDRLKEKQAIERKLHEQELKNVTMQKLLNDAQFLALQSQINPHFLFNTINIISRMAMFEKAEKTDSLIQSLSQILRYSLRTRGREVLLEDEIKVVSQYMRIQRYRFGERVRYSEEGVEERLTKTILIPPFTLQPIVENAIIHGIEPKIQGGEVRIRLIEKMDDVYIRIIDNGLGIAKSELSALMDKKTDSRKSIGLQNVVERMKLYLQQENCVRIWSKEGMGTIITIHIANTKQN